MATMDDKKVEEIVARVVDKLAPLLDRSGGSAGARSSSHRPIPTPARGEVCAPTPPEPAWRAANAARAVDGGAALHRGGKRGVYDDVDGAVKAARAAHETLVHK